MGVPFPAQASIFAVPSVEMQDSPGTFLPLFFCSFIFLCSADIIDLWDNSIAERPSTRSLK